MLRRSVAGFLALFLVCAATYGAQKKLVDINSATEADLTTSLGIERTAARKIVDGRPYRNKHELVTRQFLTPDQYDKVKAMIVAKKPTTPKPPIKAVKPLNPER